MFENDEVSSPWYHIMSMPLDSSILSLTVKYCLLFQQFSSFCLCVFPGLHLCQAAAKKGLFNGIVGQGERLLVGFTGGLPLAVSA